MDSSIQVPTLAVNDCCDKHTSENMDTLMQQVLKKYKIKKSQLLAVLCDNAEQIFKTVRLLKKWTEVFSVQHNILAAVFADLRYRIGDFGTVFCRIDAVLNALSENDIVMRMNSSGNWTSWQQDPKICNSLNY